MKDQIKISEIIKNLNQAIGKGDLNKLDLFFHENIKIVDPNLKILGDGKKICIQSYIDFINKAKIEKYNDNINDIFIYKNTAIVFYSYSMTWLTDEKSYSDTGKELYVLTKENDKWLIVLRKLIAVSN